MSETMNNNNNGNSNSNSNISSPNWLGFSLSPHMKMKEAEHNHHHFNTSLPSAVSTSFYVSSSSSTYAENDAFHSPLSVIPLKSDGSLCLMEALSTSQSLQGNKRMFFFPSNIFSNHIELVCLCVCVCVNLICFKGYFYIPL